MRELLVFICSPKQDRVRIHIKNGWHLGKCSRKYHATVKNGVTWCLSRTMHPCYIGRKNLCHGAYNRIPSIPCAQSRYNRYNSSPFFCFLWSIYSVAIQWKTLPVIAAQKHRLRCCSRARSRAHRRRKSGNLGLSMTVSRGSDSGEDHRLFWGRRGSSGAATPAGASRSGVVAMASRSYYGGCRFPCRSLQLWRREHQIPNGRSDLVAVGRLTGDSSTAKTVSSSYCDE
jgi:hypothetical protein